MTDLRKAAEMALEALMQKGEHHPKVYQAAEALRQALARPVDAVNISQKRVDKTEKSIHEPVAWYGVDDGGEKYLGWDKHDLHDEGFAWTVPLYTAPQKREWVGYTNEDRERIVPMLVQSLINHDEKTMAGLLNAILIDIEQQLKEKNGG